MKIIILILLIVNILLMGYNINELNVIKDQLKPLKIFFRLYSEQSNDLKRKLKAPLLPFLAFSISKESLFSELFFIYVNSF